MLNLFFITGRLIPLDNNDFNDSTCIVLLSPIVGYFYCKYYGLDYVNFYDFNYDLELINVYLPDGTFVVSADQVNEYFERNKDV